MLPKSQVPVRSSPSNKLILVRLLKKHGEVQVLDLADNNLSKLESLEALTQLRTRTCQETS